MSRMRLAASAVLLLAVCARADADSHPAGSQTGAAAKGVAVGAGAATGAPKMLVLVFPSTYPYCKLSYADGTPYTDIVINDYQCDYLHATIQTDTGADKFFDALPTLDAQIAFLRDAESNADQAHDRYMFAIVDAARQNDPAKAPKGPPEKRLAALMALNHKFYTAAIAAAKPFLWPPAQPDSYIEPSNGSFPDSWIPYIRPAFDTWRNIGNGINAEEAAMIDATSARVRQNLSARLVGPGGAEKAPAATLAQLNQYFDGGTTRGSAPGVPKVPSGSSAAPPPPAPAVTGVGVTSDLEAPAPPAPAPITIPDDPEARAQRNYFARGAAAGVQRLKDDATIQMWHAFGMTQTVGDPADKAQYIVSQVNGTCGIGAQYEALRARGFNVRMPDLTRTAEDKGWYVEYRSADGTGGGTVGGNIAALMTLHGVAAKVVLNGATDAQLQNGIRASGDAIVVVNAKVLWADKNLPDVSPHEIYVSGMEVDRSGVVRGYYINDTGADEAARFVSAQTFDQAWLHELVTFPPAAAAKSVGGGGH